MGHLIERRKRSAVVERFLSFVNKKEAQQVAENRKIYRTENISRLLSFVNKKEAQQIAENRKRYRTERISRFLSFVEKKEAENRKIYRTENELLHGLRDPTEPLLRGVEELRRVVTRATSDEVLEEPYVKEMRSFLNEAEDVLDSYTVLVNLERSKPAYSRFVNKLQYSRKLWSLAREIQSLTKHQRELKERAISILDLASSSYLESRAQEIVPIYLEREKAHSVVEDNMVGFEDALTEVIKLLTGESRHLEVISIVGKVGLGKTILAKNVLTDQRIESQFPVRVFVRVSQPYGIREVLLNILRSCAQVTYELVMMPEAELAKHVSKLLEDKRYLIIMDDVREKEDWDKLKVALSNRKNCSRVLITTRKKYVAAHANPSIKPYYLRLLRLEESRKLLRSKVFGENYFCIPELEAYELEIAAKCDGLPLAILLTAGYLLNDRESIHWWERVVEYLHKYNVRDQEHAEGLVHLCYNHLPYHLKLCFLYLGVFPMGFEIPVSTLLRLWIAEQFIVQEDSMSVEEVAERYLEELVSRNLVIVGKRSHEGRIKTCQINETLRDFCKKKAVEEDLFQEIEMANEAFHLSRNPSLDDQRRLCISSNVLEYFSSKPSCERLRTFLTFADKETALSPKHVSSFAKAFKMLRVLEARSLILTRFPLELCKLLLLKYLAISCSFKTIPPEMSNLQNLQTLIVETTSRTLGIRADIWKMKQLRHLHSNASMDLLSPSKGKEENRNLQIMSTISTESCKEDVFCRTPNLKKLGIRGKLDFLFEANTDVMYLFGLLTSLENLKLFNDDVTVRPRRLPPRYSFPANLRRLTLFNTLLPWDEMRKLRMLPNLEVLKLKDNAFEGNVWESQDGGFPRLRVLQIWKTNLVRWNASADHFPSLRGLVLKHCTELESLPLGLGDIPTLEFIDLEYTNQSVISSAREIQSLTVDAGQLGPRGRGLKLSVCPPED